MRVLDDKHHAVGPWHPHLDPAELQVGLRWIMLNRIFDERMWQAQRQGKISFYMQSTGEEAVSIGQGMALRPGDMLFPLVPQPGPVPVPRRQALRPHVPVPVEHRRHVQGPTDADHVSLAKGNIFSISGNLATQYPARGGLGHGGGDQGRGSRGGGLGR